MRYTRPVESGVVAAAVWDGERWSIDLDVATDAAVAPVESDDPGLPDATALVLRNGITALRSGAGDRSVDAVAEQLVTGNGRRELSAATAEGRRAYTVSIGRRGLIANRLCLTAEAPGFVPRLVPAEPDRRGRLHADEMSDWAVRCDDSDWVRLPIWSVLANWMIDTRSDSPLAGTWWVSDVQDPATPLAPLRESERASVVTAFLNGTEDLPDHGGPGARGWADPGITGRWLMLHQWRPFDDARAFGALVGFVVGDDVRCFYWPDRSSVLPVEVRGSRRWESSDKRKLQGMVRELVASSGLPNSWETGAVGPAAEADVS